MLVKILDSDLVRRYGGTHVEMDFNLAKRLKSMGKIKFIDNLVYDFPDVDSDSVVVFEEDKTILKSNLVLISKKDEQYIFPESIIGRNNK